MAAQSVQFVGISEVLKAFDNQEVTAWAVFQGRNLNFSYAGDDPQQSRDELNEWLRLLNSRGDADPNNYVTQAVYTLKFYDDFRGSRITGQTPETSAFNFKLGDNISRGVVVPSRIGGVDLLVDEVRELKETIAGLKDLRPADPPQPAEEKLEPWEKVLDHPLTMGIIGKIFGIDLGPLLAGDGKLSGVPDGAGMDQVIDELLKYDPDLLEHLKKLLVIAEHQPNTFKMLLGMVEKM